MIDAIDVPFKWALMTSARQCRAWSEGRVTLLGDACHATLPMLAQGAVMAHRGRHRAGALPCEIRMRITRPRSRATRRRAFVRTTSVVDGSAENARRFHNPRLADERGAEDYIATEWSEPKIEQRYDWLFTYDALAVDI